MWRRAVNPTLSRSVPNYVLNNIDILAPAAGIINGAECRLFTNLPTPNPDQVPADFTEANFVGYALITPLAWTPSGNVGNVGVLVHFEANFVAGAIVAPGQTVQGYYITSAAAAAVLAAERFIDPAPFAIPGDFLSLDLVLELRFVWPVTPA